MLTICALLAIERSNKNMGGLKRDQGQKAASWEPQTYRNGMDLHKCTLKKKVLHLYYV